MIKLSNKVTGDELTADEWDNHSKELETVVENVGISLSNNTDDLSKAIDIFSKSTFYETTNNGNDYTIISRGLNVEELKKGMSIVVRFNVANSGAVTLNINGTAINVKNSDGSILTDMRFKDNDIIPLIYDGSDFISVFYLNKYINNNSDGAFLYYTTNDSDISPYVVWHDTFGTNPTFDTLAVRGTIQNNLLVCQVLLFANTDEIDNSIDFYFAKLKIGDIFRDKLNYDLDIIQYVGLTCNITGELSNAPYAYSNINLLGDIYRYDDTTNPNTIIFGDGSKVWKLETAYTKHNRVRINMSFTSHIKRV